jgi:hypothetical protein
MNSLARCLREGYEYRYQYGPLRRTSAGRYGRTRQCRTSSKLRSERVARKLYQLSESSACLCRSRAGHPPRPLCRPRIRRPGIPSGRKSRSAKKKSPTSAWGPSTSSTRNTPARPTSGKRLRSGAEAAEAAEAAAEAAVAAAAAAAAVVAAEAAAAACPGDVAPSARLQHVPITLTDATRYGRVRIGPGHFLARAARRHIATRSANNVIPS